MRAHRLRKISHGSLIFATNGQREASSLGETCTVPGKKREKVSLLMILTRRWVVRLDAIDSRCQIRAQVIPTERDRKYFERGRNEGDIKRIRDRSLGQRCFFNVVGLLLIIFFFYFFFSYIIFFLSFFWPPAHTFVFRFKLVNT